MERGERRGEGRERRGERGPGQQELSSILYPLAALIYRPSCVGVGVIDHWL